MSEDRKELRSDHFGVVKDFFSMKVADVIVWILLGRIKKYKPSLIPRLVAAAHDHPTKFETLLAGIMQGVQYLFSRFLPKGIREYAEDALARAPGAFINELKTYERTAGVTVAEADLEGIKTETESVFQSILDKIKGKGLTFRDLWKEYWRHHQEAADHRLAAINERLGKSADDGLVKKDKTKTLRERNRIRLEHANARLEQLKNANA